MSALPQLKTPQSYQKPPQMAQNSETQAQTAQDTPETVRGRQSRIPAWVRKYFWREMRKIDADLVYMILEENSSYNTHRTRPGVRLLAQAARIRPAAVVVALRWLEDKKLIRLVVPATGRGAAVYHIEQKPPAGIPYQVDFRPAEVCASQTEVCASQNTEPEQSESCDIEPETPENTEKTPEPAGSASLFSLQENTSHVVCSDKILESADRAYRFFREKSPAADVAFAAVLAAVRNWPTATVLQAVGRCNLKTVSFGAVNYTLQDKPTREDIERRRSEQVLRDAVIRENRRHNLATKLDPEKYRAMMAAGRPKVA